jgi:hypothetical protein
MAIGSAEALWEEAGSYLLFVGDVLPQFRRAVKRVGRTSRVDVAEWLLPLYVARAAPKINWNDGAICLEDSVGIEDE